MKSNYFTKKYEKILPFEWDLFVTDSHAPPFKKEQLQNDSDYLILKGSYSGKIGRYCGTTKPTRFASFRSTRGNEFRIRCDEDGFACVPRLGCWMESLDSLDRTQSRPPILLLQSRSIFGAPFQNRLVFGVREGKNLIGHFELTNTTPEIIELSRVEEILGKMGNHRKANPTLKNLMQRGYYVCYEDDGWLLKSSRTARIRFMRRSHLIQITVCRCGRDVVDAMMDDVTLRILLPVRNFAGYVGRKVEARPGHLRRTSTMASMGNIDVSDLLDDYDKTICYARIFQREGATIGNLLVLDTPFLDAIRSYMENGGLSRNCICPSVAKWRRMLKFAASGEEPFLRMSDVHIINGQWSDVLDVTPNSRFKRFSFSVVYYDGTTKVSSPRIAHKVLRPVRPKDDIARVFENQLLMNGGYLIVALSRRGISDDALPPLFDNVEEFIYHRARENGFLARRIALGVHRDMMIYVDFQVYRTKRRESFSDDDHVQFPEVAVN